MHQFLAYFKFLWHSKNEHGVHSPFVYDLLTNCLYKKEEKSAFKIIKTYRQALLKDEREILVKDFGAGSRVFKSNKRKIADIAKNAGISRRRAILLNKLTSYLGVKSAIELGTSVGISSAAIAAGNDLELFTIEGCPETAKIAGEYFKRFKLESIQLVTGSFEEKAPQPPMGELKVQISKSKPQFGYLEIQLKNDNPKPKTENRNPTGNLPHPPKGELKFQIPNSKIPNDPHHTTYNTPPTNDHRPLTTDLVYFDGNHQKEATLRYFHQLLPLAHNDSVFIFDDIHWSAGMEKAWEEIKKHPRVRVTIDSFYWGIVFFREEQEKEHFIIRL